MVDSITNGRAFSKDRDTIGVHVKNIYEEGELEQVSTTENYSVVRQEGNRSVKRSIVHYNLDVIIPLVIVLHPIEGPNLESGQPKD